MSSELPPQTMLLPEQQVALSHVANAEQYRQDATHPNYSPDFQKTLDGLATAEASTVHQTEAYAAQTATAEADQPRHEITPEHHAEHVTLASAFDANISERSPAEQDLIGEVIELGDTATGHDMAATTAKSIIAESGAEKPSLGTELASIPETLRPRIEKALNDSEFQRSPELERSIESYYVDHSRLAKVIEGVADNNISAEDAQRIAQGEFDGPSYAMNQAMKRLVIANQDPSKREEALRDAAEVVTGMLFNERCVGALTADKADFSIIPELYSKIRDAAVRDGVAFVGGKEGAQDYYWQTAKSSFDLTQRMPSETVTREITSNREHLADEVWEDSRFAGQLLFHNTANMDKIALDGYQLKSRSAQAAESGSFVAQTAVMNQQHTNVMHWAENFDYRSYRGNGGLRADGTPAQPGTIAVPLAEMIKIAPYARNGEYGVLEPKTDADISKVTINDRLGDIGVGRSDVPGEDGMDRVFFGDYKSTNVQAAHEYVVDAGRGMSADTGNTSYQLFLDSEKAQEEARYGSAAVYGTGQNLPLLKTLHVDIGQQVFNSEADGQQAADAAHEQQRQAERTLEDQIAELQRTSRDRSQYANKVVMPLRQGVIEFTNEADGQQTRDDFQRYPQTSNTANMLDETVLRAARVAKGIEMSDEQIAQAEAERANIEAGLESMQRERAAEMAKTGETEDEYLDRQHAEFLDRSKILTSF